MEDVQTNALGPTARFSCTKCGLEKPSTDFPHAKGKRHSWCRECHKIANKAYRDAYRVRVPAKLRKLSDRLTPEGLCVCSKCGEAKEVTNFQNSGGWCRRCRTELERQRRKNAGMQVKEFTRVTSTHKSCGICKAEKLFSEFYSATRGSAGLSYACKACLNAKPKNLEAVREATKKYRSENPERHKALHRLTQYRRKTKQVVASDGTVTDEVLKSLYNKEHCEYCKKATEQNQRTIDHVVALNSGGKHTAKNLVMACRQCNSAKSDRPVEKFLTRLLERTKNENITNSSNLH